MMHYVEEEQHDKNDEMSCTASSIMPAGAQQKRLIPLTPVVFLGTRYLDCTLL